MALPISLVDPHDGSTADVVLGARGDTTVRSLADCLEAAGALSAPVLGVGSLYHGSRRLDPATVLRDIPLLPGTRIGVGAPVPAELSAAARRTPADPGGEGTAAVVEIRTVSGPNSGRVWALDMGVYDLGAARGCALRPEEPEPGEAAAETRISAGAGGGCDRPPGSARPRLPDRAATIRVAADGTTTFEPYPGTAAELDGVALDGPRVWKPGALLTLGDQLLALREPFRADAPVEPTVDGLAVEYHRPPRVTSAVEPVRLLLPKPPHPPHRRSLPVLVSLAPLVVAVGLAFMMRSSYLLILAVLAPPLALAASVADNRRGMALHRRETARYHARCAELGEEADAAVERERTVREYAGPDPAEALLIATGPGRRLWERRPTDPDRLLLRVGTAGLPSEVSVEDPDAAGDRRTEHLVARDVPVQIPLAELGVVGIVGEPGPCYGLARWLVTQIAVLHSPRDVRLHILCDAGTVEEWTWARWLPHSSSGRSGGPYVNLGTDRETVAARTAELVATVNARLETRRSGTPSAVLDEPDIVVVLDGARRLRDMPGVARILRGGPAVGVYAICLDRAERLLPEEAAAVVFAGADCLTVRLPGDDELRRVRPDLVTASWSERVARALAPLREASRDDDGALPDVVRLAEVLRLDDTLVGAGGAPLAAELVRRWERSPASTTVLMGIGHDGSFGVDLVRDGPHALVAGTTGAGKSELLQSLVAGLAAGNRPDEMVFVLIDYRGGAAFKDCADLPHTVGMVTDLDPHLSERALTSLGAELRRRETVLAEAGAKDLPDYQAKRADDPDLAALPRLVLVVDEFATLVREVPDFVPGLVGIAQRGRSLGIHLVLATQRPAGVVSSDVRANTNLRIALRVTDAAESHDVLDVPDAATISPATPGRAMARLGHGRVVAFQTAYAASPAQESDSFQAPVWATLVTPSRLGRPLRTPELDTDECGHAPRVGGVRSELTLLVEAMGAAARTLGVVAQPSPWLPALGTLVPLETLPEPEPEPVPDVAAGTAGYLRPVAYGIEDIPAERRQRPVVVDFATFRHLSVVGAGRSGRSQTLRTIAGAVAGIHSCADVHMYGIDADDGALAPVADLPHCGAVVPGTDRERVMRLLTKLRRDIAARQYLAARNDCANLSELRAVLPADQRPAHVLVFVDGWEGVAAAFADRDQGRLVDEFANLLREGPVVGVHLLMTSDGEPLGGRIGGLDENRLVLGVAGRTEEAVAANSDSVMPPGRGVRSHSGAETQVAVLGPDPGGPGQVAALGAIAVRADKRDANVPERRRAAPVAGPPGTVDVADLLVRIRPEHRRPMWALVGVGGDEMGAWGVDLAGRSHIFAVAGPPGTGRSTALVTMTASLLAFGTRAILVTPRDTPLRALAAHPGVTAHLPGAELAERPLLDALARADGEPVVVVVDDAELHVNCLADRVLRGIVASGRERGIGLIYAGVADVVTQHMSGWLGEARRARNGALIAPRSTVEGDLLGVRLPPGALHEHPRPGRATVVDPTTGATLTIRLPNTSAREL